MPRESTTVCPNGHVYSSNLSKCPFCPSPDLKDMLNSNNIFNQSTATNRPLGSDKTKIIGGSGDSKSNRTMIVGPDDANAEVSVRPARKIIGWLVSFTLKKEGEDFRVYEGRNLLSGDSKDDIFINDPSISSPHCMLLYRGGKIILRDEMSTNGTIVNGEEISEIELKDGDLIKIGRTELKFRTI
jgi:pSer/pThr/pTyr-binding forkhead associated (FHA) protein